MIKFGYDTYTQTPISIMGDMTINVSLLQIKTPPSNLQIDAKTLHTSWSPPRMEVVMFTEAWASGNFTANGWTISGGTNWSVTTGVGNPAPSAQFYYSPTVYDYHQYLTSKIFAGPHSPSLLLKYDIFLSNFGTTNENTMAVELWNGTTWTVLKSYTNLNGNIAWTSESLDISSVTNATEFRVRFHAAGVDSYDINNWNVDNIKIVASDGSTGPNPCVLGYNFYLNNLVSGFTTDTTYIIPSNQVVYGQTYNGCVLAIYGSGYSPKICKTFTSTFLCPVSNLTAQAVENSVYLEWDKPMCTAGEPKCYVYDDGTMENGWAFNPGYLRWLGNKFPAPSTDVGQLQSFKMMWWNNGAATNQTFYIDVYTLAGTLIGTSQPFQVPIPAPTGYMTLTLTTGIDFTGPFYGMVRWNNFSGATHWFGYDQNGPFVPQNLAYGYDGTTFTTWSSYAGTVAGVFCLQACGMVNGDQVVYGGEPIVPMAEGNAVASQTLLTHSPFGESAPTTGTIEETNSDALLATGLLGYNLYNADGSFVHYVPGADSLSSYVFDLDPGTYCYNVKAWYDLSVYSLPGNDESMAQEGGPVCASLNYGRPLPFCESWDQGSFAYNGWMVPAGSNWMMNTGTGNPAPSADFSWQPIQPNYMMEIESPVLNAAPWNCSTIWLDFDYKLTDRNATGNEKLKVEVLWGGTWHQKAEYVNTGTTNWTSQHFEITGAKGKALKVRFTAYGPNSADILHWYVDNICVYGICNPPTALAASQNQFTTTLTWTAPECGGGGTIMQFIFDDGTAENGWAINPGYLAWLGNEFPISSTLDGVLQSIDVWFGFGAASSAQFVIDIFDAGHTLVGSSDPFTGPTEDWMTIQVNDIPFAGLFYAMLKWDNFSVATNYLGFDEDGPYSTDNLGWYYDGTTWDKISIVGGGNPGVFLVRATALVGGDLKSVTLVPGAQPSGMSANSAPLTKVPNPTKVNTGNYSVMGVVENLSDSSQLMGYNVYRTDETGQGAFTKLIGPVTVTTYADTYPPTLESGTFRYFVTDVFNDSETGLMLCESSSDTITVEFPAVGINEVTSARSRSTRTLPRRS